MKTAEVAALFQVDMRTVVRWVKEGKVEGIWTPGHRLLFRRDMIERWLAGDS